MSDPSKHVEKKIKVEEEFKLLNVQVFEHEDKFWQEVANFLIKVMKGARKEQIIKQLVQSLQCELEESGIEALIGDDLSRELRISTLKGFIEKALSSGTEETLDGYHFLIIRPVEICGTVLA